MQTYETYKNSGIDWLGEIPSHWEIESFKNILNERNEKNFPVKTEDRLSLSIDKGVTVYGEKTTNLDRFKDDVSLYKLAYKGDLVFNSMNMIVGALGVSDYFGCVSPVYYTYYSLKNVTKFYEYFFRNKNTQAVLYSLGKGLIAIDRGDGKYNTLRLKVSREDLRSFKIPLPPIAEQEAIAAFLDEKCGKIDELVSVKEQQIALLKERRQVLIYEAVTKGIQPNVELKHSGIDWIGEIPSHWEVKEIRRITKFHNQGFYTTESYVVKGVKLMRITDFRPNGKFDLTDAPMVRDDKTLSNYVLVKNDFVFARTGGAGNFAIIEDINEKAVFASYLIRFKFNNDLINEFLKYFFNSHLFKNGIEQEIHGGVNQNIHAENIKNQYIFIPPISEQEAIVAYLEEQTGKIDQAIALKTEQIEKLKAYKQSLINEVVTGKVKVC